MKGQANGRFPLDDRADLLAVAAKKKPQKLVVEREMNALPYAS